MKTWAFALSLVACALAGAAPVEAQLAGKWTLEFGEWQAGEGRQVRIPGGNRGTLEVTVRGDSAFAVFTDEDPEPQALKGRVQSGSTLLVGTREAMVNRNGEETEVVLTFEIEMQVASSEATGTMRLKAGPGEPVARTFKGRLAR